MRKIDAVIIPNRFVVLLRHGIYIIDVFLRDIIGYLRAAQFGQRLDHAVYIYLIVLMPRFVFVLQKRGG